MHIRLIAVGDRQPDWVQKASEAYAARLPRVWRFEVDVVPTVRRTRAGQSPADAEVEQILARLGDDERLVLLDERGKSLTSRALAETLADWQNDGRDVALVIGGPDGVNQRCRDRADATLSLSSLTLPHGLARVLVIEQLYRASSLLAGHPYHRD